MAESSTLEAFLRGNAQFRPDLSDILWQCVCEMDRLHSDRFIGRLDPQTILVIHRNGHFVLSFRHIVKENYTARRLSKTMRSFGSFARLLAAATRSRFDPIFERFVCQLEQSDSLRRPHSFHLLLSDPFFLLNRSEARSRIARLFDSQVHFRKRLVDPDQLIRFHQSADAQLRREDFNVLEQLTCKLAEDLDISDWLTECRLRVPLPASCFVNYAISPISFILTHPQDESGNSALHLAAKLSADAEIVRFLLELGADVSATNRNGWTPLHWAALANQNAEIVDLLLDHKADPNARDVDGHTPLHAAAAKNANHVITRSLLREGADANCCNEDGSSALHLAARFNANPSVVRQLLNFGAKVNASGPQGQTPLHLAVKNETKTDDISSGMVATLLEHGADIAAVDWRGRNALHRAAAEAGDAELIQFLLDNGADVHAADSQGKIALQLALESSASRDVVELLEIASDITHTDDENDVTCCVLS